MCAIIIILKYQQNSLLSNVKLLYVFCRNVLYFSRYGQIKPKETLFFMRNVVDLNWRTPLQTELLLSPGGWESLVLFPYSCKKKDEAFECERQQKPRYIWCNTEKGGGPVSSYLLKPPDSQWLLLTKQARQSASSKASNSSLLSPEVQGLGGMMKQSISLVFSFLSSLLSLPSSAQSAEAQSV